MWSAGGLPAIIDFMLEAIIAKQATFGENAFITAAGQKTLAQQNIRVYGLDLLPFRHY